MDFISIKNMKWTSGIFISGKGMPEVFYFQGRAPTFLFSRKGIIQYEIADGKGIPGESSNTK